MKTTTKKCFLRAAMLLTMVLTTTSVWATITGSGTKTDPYVLYDAADWATFANQNNANTYWGSNVYVKLSDSWDNSSSGVTDMVGTDGSRFCGTFNGNGKTLTFTATATGDNCAPFCYIEGATIMCLKVAGTITTSKQFAAGVAVQSFGNCTIQNCQSSVTINTTVSGDGTHAGFVAVHQSGTLTITNCLFDGTITGSNTTNCGGFVGWRTGTLTFNNCLMAGTLGISIDNNSATFSRNNGEKTTLNHCYYKTSYGTVQGEAVGETSNATLIDSKHLGSGWEISGNNVVPITNRYNMAVVTVSGLKNNYLYDNDNAIAISYTVTDLEGTQLTPGTHFSAAITKGGETVNSVSAKGEYVLTLTGLTPYTGTKVLNFTVSDVDVTISSAADWNTFASKVSGGESYRDKYVKLSDNFDNSANPIQRMVGSSEHKFCGTFLGNGRTLTINLSANTNDCAPFLCLDGATIQDLTITGTITTPEKYGASIAAHTYGTTNITNCTSNVTIQSTVGVSDDRTHGGFVAMNESDATLNFTNCVFKGQMLGGNATSCGGFVGWNGGTRINYTDCLFEPTQLTMSTESSNTFNRNGNNTLTRCYFTQAFGDEEGTRVYTTEQSDFCNKLELHGNYYYYVGDAFITTPTRYDYNGGSPITVTPAMTYDGVALNADYYTATFTLDGSPVETVAEKGYYTMTLTGNNSKGYYGSVAVGFRVPWTMENGVDYIDANGVLRNTKRDGIDGNDTPTVLTGKETSLSAGWYVVFGYVSFSSQIRYSGDVHLILADGATMKVGNSNSRIIGNAIDATSYTSVFTIYGQSAENNMGTLSIYTTVDGDGQKNCINGSSLVFNGGHIIANTTGDVALYVYKTGEYITINGGIIEANTINNGPDHPASILASNITLNGGTVSAPGIYANTPNCTLTLGGSTVTTNSLYAFRSILKVADGLIYTDGTTSFSGKLCDASDDTGGEGKYGTDFNALNTVIKGKTLKAYNGMCGTNVTWSFANETLTISGTGAMEDYTSSDNQPWRSLGSDIKNVVVEDGVSHIGNSAFELLNLVQHITIGKDVETIGDYACKNCSLRVSLIIPPSVTKIGTGAFANNDLLERVYVLSTTVPTLGTGAFAVRDDLNTFDILVPSAKEGDYETAWTAYKDIINPFYIITAEPQANMTLTGNNGVQYGSTVYAPNGKIKLTMTDPSNPPAGYNAEATYQTTTGEISGSGTSYTLTVLNQDVSITCFTLANYSITYHVNEGATFTTTKNQYTIESDDITLDTPSKDGYTFYGWYENAEFTGNPVTIIYHGSTGPKEFWAKLKKDFTKCTVSVPDQVLGSNSYICYKFWDTPATIGASVKDGETPLTLGTDYEFGRVTYADLTTHNETDMPNKVGDACRVEIKGKGEYDGAQWAYFNIVNPSGSGKWGDNDNITWSLSDCTLTFSGSGDMKELDNNEYPWLTYKNFIETITIGDGITSVAANAFATDRTDYHYIVSTVNLPSTLQSIGEYAFSYCTGATITIPAGVTSIGTNAFQEVLKVSAQLSDNADNTDILSELSVAKKNDVTLQGRTLWKDGNWNTLCLPFDLEDADYSNTYIDEFHSGEFGGKDGIVLTGTLLEGCTLMELDVDGYYNNEGKPWPGNTTYDGYRQTGFDKDNCTLYLYFKNANSIKAGKPYIIKWNNGDNLVNPTFTDVKISDYALKDVTSKDNGEETGFVTFKGTYTSTTFDNEDKSKLLLGVAKNNQNEDMSILYYPQPKNDTNPSIGAFRAFFQLNNGLNAGSSMPQWTVKSFVLNFGEDTTTSIHNSQFLKGQASQSAERIIQNEADAWYTIDGRKVNTPSLGEGRGGLTPGLYIHKGKKIVIK